MIEAKGVCLNYSGGIEVLKEVNMEIKSGEMVYIIGPSGSGKTSLLKLFMGIEYPTAGTLTVLGQPIVSGQVSRIRKMRRLIGPVFQDFRLIKGRTVIENVMLGARFFNISHKQLKRNSVEALKKVGLERKLFSLVDNLSLGECQRVAIARALVRQPRLIIADEPTGNLDKDNALNIMDIFTSLHKENTTVIVTTHAIHLLNRIKEGKLVTIENGFIREERLG